MGAGGFIEIIKPDDVALNDLFERLFHRYAAKVDNPVATGDHGINGICVRQVALHAFLVRACRV